MSAPLDTIPVVLFAYARTAHLARVLACLRANRVPLIEAFADGPKGAADASRVAETRTMLRAIDWCEVRLIERAENMGLGRNILAGVSEVAARHNAFIVWEDDLIAVPGTYAWMCAALRQFAQDERVMSVTAWTHPRVIPASISDRPYFDGRAECWVWGAWTRSWHGMKDETAATKLAAAEKRGIRADAYGGDLPRMAEAEERQNIWAVRWLYHHFQHGGLCVRPPWSMVEHIGFDTSATNAQHATEWANPPLRVAPPVPEVWPVADEHPDCRRLWRAANPSKRLSWARAYSRGRRVLKGVVPPQWQRWLRRLRQTRVYHGDYVGWAEAQRASRGYGDPAIAEKTIWAARAVRDGLAAWERDTVLFQTPEANEPLLRTLRAVADEEGGQLHLVDFGGALGSTWWQHRPWLTDINSVRWSVVEQTALVAAGQAEFSGGPVKFYSSLTECSRVERPAVVLLSSVLPYLEKPHDLLAEIAAGSFRHVIIDRTGFVTRRRDRLTVQRVPPEIYDASYPCWFFNRTTLLGALGVDWELIDEWRTTDAVDIDAEYLGMRFRRRSTLRKTSAES